MTNGKNSLLIWKGLSVFLEFSQHNFGLFFFKYSSPSCRVSGSFLLFVSGRAMAWTNQRWALWSRDPCPPTTAHLDPHHEVDWAEDEDWEDGVDGGEKRDEGGQHGAQPRHGARERQGGRPDKDWGYISCCYVTSCEPIPAHLTTVGNSSLV